MDPLSKTQTQSPNKKMTPLRKSKPDDSFLRSSTSRSKSKSAKRKLAPKSPIQAHDHMEKSFAGVYRLNDAGMVPTTEKND